VQRFKEDKPGETPITGVEKIEEEKPIEREVVMNFYFSTTISKVINRQSTWTISDMKFDSINKTMYYPLWLTMIGSFLLTLNTTGRLNKTQCNIQGVQEAHVPPPPPRVKKINENPFSCNILYFFCNIFDGIFFITFFSL
jgi:hypothetical protein